MIDVKLTSATGSQVKTAKLYLDSGLISYIENGKTTWEHIGSLKAFGWVITQEPEAPKAEEKKPKVKK